MRLFWEQLTKSQKQIVIAGLGFVAAALLVQFAVFPYFEARQKVASRSPERKPSARDPRRGAWRPERRSEEIRRVIERRPPDLRSFLPGKEGTSTGVKTNIKSINPLKSPPADAYEEAAVEMRMDKLTMKQLTDFLYLVESREDLVRIRKMSVVKMKESPEYLSVLLQVFTYQALPPGGSR
jgi:hypothetical protein